MIILLRNAERCATYLAVILIAVNPAAVGADGNLPAPPSPCGTDVTYYVPQEPVVLSSSTGVHSLDQVAIRCDYKAVTGRIEWPTCDADAKTAMQILQMAKESGSRYSGMLTIDGQNVGVTTSPLEGGDFSSEQTWSYDTAGDHEVSCQIDNGLKYAAQDGLDYLVQAISHEVGIAADIQQFLPLDINTLKSIAVNRVRAGIAPLPEGAQVLLRIATAPNPEVNGELQAIVEAIERDGELTADTKRRWHTLAMQLRSGADDLDMNGLLQTALTESYLDNGEDLRHYADSVADMNQKKNDVRDEIENSKRTMIKTLLLESLADFKE